MSRGLRFPESAVDQVNGTASVTPTRRRNLQLELDEQIAFIKWTEYQQFIHVDGDGRKITICLRELVDCSLNGAHLAGDKRQRIIQWQKMQRAGARKSSADLTINYPIGKYCGMKIEFKKRRDHFRTEAERRKALSAAQADYLQLMRRVGFNAVVAYGWIEAAIEVCRYFEWNPQSRGM